MNDYVILIIAVEILSFIEFGRWYSTSDEKLKELYTISCEITQGISIMIFMLMNIIELLGG